jgi:adenylylsulfate kinase
MAPSLHHPGDQYDGRVPTTALLITGTVGSGKTSVAERAGDLLARDQVPHAVVDLDWLRRSWPAPAGDPFNLELGLRNLAAVARTYAAAGARRLLLAGVVESRADRRRHERAVLSAPGCQGPLSVVRLDVDSPVVRSRLARRHADDPAGLRWHLDRSGELDAILRTAKVEDAAVPAAGPLDEVADAVLRAAGWR